MPEIEVLVRLPTRPAWFGLLLLLSGCPREDAANDTPWADPTLTWDYYGCGWARVHGGTQEWRHWFFLDVDMDALVGDAEADFSVTADVGTQMEVLYVTSAEPTTELELAYDNCSWPEADPSLFDSLGTWWVSTSGVATLQGEYIGTEPTGCDGVAPIHQVELELADVYFQDVFTGALAAEPLERLTITDIRFGYLPCEG